MTTELPETPWTQSALLPDISHHITTLSPWMPHHSIKHFTQSSVEAWGPERNVHTLLLIHATTQHHFFGIVLHVITYAFMGSPRFFAVLMCADSFRIG